ncbi:MULTISPECIES: DUF1707 SHOCT-like domain-containing protein [Pseudonocardia]|uniref:DUF1707 domain-containing protein n=2 Tax=Pseudonocardia TaxID=1847 RepID=A0A1Y2N1L4_PSEAH|nr:MULTISPECIES: DUF1707 domain-containing protein [Pseudonocardia]OSY41079.1 hypothetical protein BG845_02421 [Pseudonocardia autotrophica]TDN73794.1 uncharacterized protein DUF1707 [Pseudonocardia autotrophica]BBG04540.1 hypothetical protein Pdca_57490 [Pseudonocardia autotrophica]GEC27876.1 hypothetical protein PSA01_49050 [Pseudonocardia saturnea]
MGDDYRIGDAERRAVDDRLQRAHGEGRLTLEEYEERAAKAWAARHHSELTGLTGDLPPDRAPARRADATPAPSRARELGLEWARAAGGTLTTIALVAAALWGGSHLLGGADGTVVFGSRTVGVAEDRDRVEMGVLFGSVRVVVPDDARVTVGGWKAFGSVDCETACANTGGRTVQVDVTGAFGSTDIVTRSEAAADPDDD